MLDLLKPSKQVAKIGTALPWTQPTITGSKTSATIQPPIKKVSTRKVGKCTLTGLQLLNRQRREKKLKQEAELLEASRRPIVPQGDSRKDVSPPVVCTSASAPKDPNTIQTNSTVNSAHSDSSTSIAVTIPTGATSYVSERMEPPLVQSTILHSAQTEASSRQRSDICADQLHELSYGRIRSHRLHCATDPPGSPPKPFASMLAKYSSYLSNKSLSSYEHLLTTRSISPIDSGYSQLSRQSTHSDAAENEHFRVPCFDAPLTCDHTLFSTTDAAIFPLESSNMHTGVIRRLLDNPAGINSDDRFLLQAIPRVSQRSKRQYYLTDNLSFMSLLLEKSSIDLLYRINMLCRSAALWRITKALLFGKMYPALVHSKLLKSHIGASETCSNMFIDNQTVFGDPKVTYLDSELVAYRLKHTYISQESLDSLTSPGSSLINDASPRVQKAATCLASVPHSIKSSIARTLNSSSSTARADSDTSSSGQASSSALMSDTFVLKQIDSGGKLVTTSLSDSTHASSSPPLALNYIQSSSMTASLLANSMCMDSLFGAQTSNAVSDFYALGTCTVGSTKFLELRVVMLEALTGANSTILNEQVLRLEVSSRASLPAKPRGIQSYSTLYKTDSRQPLSQYSNKSATLRRGLEALADKSPTPKYLFPSPFLYFSLTSNLAHCTHKTTVDKSTRQPQQRDDSQRRFINVCWLSSVTVIEMLINHTSRPMSFIRNPSSLVCKKLVQVIDTATLDLSCKAVSSLVATTSAATTAQSVTPCVMLPTKQSLLIINSPGRAIITGIGLPVYFFLTSRPDVPVFPVKELTGEMELCTGFLPLRFAKRKINDHYLLSTNRARIYIVGFSVSQYGCVLLSDFSTKHASVQLCGSAGQSPSSSTYMFPRDKLLKHHKPGVCDKTRFLIMCALPHAIYEATIRLVSASGDAAEICGIPNRIVTTACNERLYCTFDARRISFCAERGLKCTPLPGSDLANCCLVAPYTKLALHVFLSNHYPPAFLPIILTSANVGPDVDVSCITSVRANDLTESLYLEVYRYAKPMCILDSGESSLTSTNKSTIALALSMIVPYSELMQKLVRISTDVGGDVSTGSATTNSEAAQSFQTPPTQSLLVRSVSLMGRPFFNSLNTSESVFLHQYATVTFVAEGNITGSARLTSTVPEREAHNTWMVMIVFDLHSQRHAVIDISELTKCAAIRHNGSPTKEVALSATTEGCRFSTTEIATTVNSFTDSIITDSRRLYSTILMTTSPTELSIVNVPCKWDN